MGTIECRTYIYGLIRFDMKYAVTSEIQLKSYVGYARVSTPDQKLDL